MNLLKCSCCTICEILAIFTPETASTCIKEMNINNLSNNLRKYNWPTNAVYTIKLPTNSAFTIKQDNLRHPGQFKAGNLWPVKTKGRVLSCCCYFLSPSFHLQQWKPPAPEETTSDSKNHCHHMNQTPNICTTPSTDTLLALHPKPSTFALWDTWEGWQV